MSDIALREAVTLHQAGRLDEAEPIYRGLLAAAPGSFNALHLLGVLLHQRGRAGEAVPLIEAALRIDSGVADAHGNLGNALRTLGRLDEAAESYRSALAIAPGLPELHLGYGQVLEGQGAYHGAVRHHETARRLRPGVPEAAIRLCSDLAGQGQETLAAALLRTMLDSDPHYAGAWVNLGLLLAQQRDFAAALDCYRRAQAIDPQLAMAHCNEAHLRLLLGNLPVGWEKHEWRLALDGAETLPPGFAQPRWTGEDLRGGTLLLHAEQGFGDSIQFCRFVPLAARRARILLSVPQPLVRLFSSLADVAEFVRPGQAVPHFDRYCSLMSLPRIFSTTLETIPADTPYLAADAGAREAWCRRLAPLPGIRVGLVWAGGARSDQEEPPAFDGRRSMTLDAMAPLAGIAGISFVSLQKGAPAAQAAQPPQGMALHDFTSELRDFADTAALIDTLDLVISVDTSVAHLAGALGKPVWLLNRFDTCWRWLHDRDDSPWYPQLRQFRQPSPGDWNSVIRGTGDALQRLAAGDRDQLRPRQAMM